MKRNVVMAWLCLGMVVMFSCKKQMDSAPPGEDLSMGQPSMERAARLNREVAQLLEQVYKDPKAFYEVNAAILSEYYEDERVLLKDLLFPEYSGLYKTKAFEDFKSPKGSFRETFYKHLGNGDYPVLKEALYGNGAAVSGTDETRAEGLKAVSPATDTTMEIFSNTKGVAIYFPYSENFGTTFSPLYFDYINTNPRGRLATIVAADREADSGPGREPYIGGTRYDMKIYYRTVTVDDNYAESMATHIVNVGAEPRAYYMGGDTASQPNSIRVYHGSSILKTQMDRFISFTGNGGGSEIKVARISGYLEMKDQQVNNFAGDLISVHYKRKDIRKRREKIVIGIWDPYWKKDNLEQVYAVWEDDTKGEKKFSGKLKSTLKTGLGTVEGEIGFDISVVTQDVLITQRKWDRVSYLALAKKDNGCGFSPLGVFLPPGEKWPYYDCGTIWQFTMPYQEF